MKRNREPDKVGVALERIVHEYYSCTEGLNVKEMVALLRQLAMFANSELEAELDILENILNAGTAPLGGQ